MYLLFRQINFRPIKQEETAHEKKLNIIFTGRIHLDKKTQGKII